MKKKIKLMIPYLLISIILIVGIMIKVYADYLYASNDVYYENNSSTLLSTDLQSAIEELDTKCETRIAASQECPEGYKCTEIPKPTCKRATTLHTETCKNSSSYCYGDGYYSGGSQGTTSITYGSLGTSGSEPSPGDAFDCDVNGDGTYDASTERFYYVSKYYDTSTQTFDSDYYTFIYYSNTNGGTPSTSTNSWYTTLTYYAPTNAKTYLPTTGTWKNIVLKNLTRDIRYTSSSGGVLTSNFSYEGYAARLLTLQELESACPNASTTEQSMKSCQYFFERTIYSSNSYAAYGFWLETAYTANLIWGVRSDSKYINTYSPTSTGYLGTRPAIEIPKSKIDY